VVAAAAPKTKRRSPSGAPSHDLVLSGHAGLNEDVFPQILSIYVTPGAKVADTTHGRGIFWKKVPAGRYNLLATDLAQGVDARSLPYEDGSIDCVVFDPPYMHSSGGTSRRGGEHEHFETYYKNNGQARVSDGHLAVLQLYFAAAREALRVLRRDGIYIVKCQDEVCANRQRLTHVEIINELVSYGWVCEDLLVLLQERRPGVSRMIKQLHFRKAHSYFLVFRAPGKKIWTGPPCHEDPCSA
jgi:hypothetical protein